MARRTASTPTPDATAPEGADAPITDAPDAPDADVTPDAPDADVTPDEGVTPDEAAHAEQAGDEQVVTQLPPVLSPRELRKRKAARQAAKQAARVRFTLADGCEWESVPSGGEVAVCDSTPNADGETFLYVVFRNRGREIAMPLTAIDRLQEVEQI